MIRPGTQSRRAIAYFVRMRGVEAISERGLTVYRKPVLGDMRWNGQRWQRWTGRRWAIAAYSLRQSRLLDPTPFGPIDEIDDAKRQRALASAVEHQVATNRAYVLYDGPTGVLLAYRRQVSHLLHMFLTLLTGGLWAVVWIAVTLGRGEDRVLLDADVWGNVWARRVTGT